MIDRVEEKIKNGIAEKLGDDVIDLSVAVSIHEYFYSENKFTRIVARVWSTDITIIKPASKLDMIKLAMPRFIQKIFPPKTVEINHTVGLPALKDIKKSKLSVLCYTTSELEEDQDALITWCVEGGSRQLKSHYSNKTFRGW